MAKKGGKSPLRWVVGLHSCREALRSHPDWVAEINLLQDKEPPAELEGELQKYKKITKLRNRKFFNELSEVHQGIAVAMSDRPRWQANDNPQQLVAFLDGLNDPHNLGAILRTAWIMGIQCLFVPKNRSVSLTATACKIASGGAEHVAIEEVHFQSQIDELKKDGFWIYGLSEKSDKFLQQANFADKSAIIIGAEGKGMRSSTLGFCDELIAIPQKPNDTSLNASVAFALATYEYFRSRF